MEEIEVLVIGAGVVGLAIARTFALAGHEVIIIDAADAVGTETSSRNSEVIHAGLYYPPGSLKAKLCVTGKHALYRYCEEHNVPYRRCGKLVVAADDGDLRYLEKLSARAAENGVDDVALIDRGQLHALEPALSGVAALLSPSTGIIDSHALMHAFAGDAESAGAMLALRTPLIAGEASPDGIRVRLGGAEPIEVSARIVINAAGLGAWQVSESIAGMTPESIPQRFLCKGNYFSLGVRSPVRHLVYPVPTPGGLGTHLTLDLAGQARFGPDVEWVEGIDYDVAPDRADRFYAAIRRYWPGLPDSALSPAYSGIRPKIVGPGDADGDFIIQGPAETGAPGYLALYGIESPGLTASMAIAERVLTLSRAG